MSGNCIVCLVAPYLTLSRIRSALYVINGKQVISIIRVCGLCYLARREGPAPSLVVLIPEL